MIRNCVIHVSSEQPLIADLFGIPTAGDAGLVCTNVRTTDGKRPSFIDSSESVFFFPYLHLRFVELPPRELARHQAEGGTGPASTAPASTGPASTAGVPAIAPAGEPASNQSLDPGQRLPVAVALPDQDPVDGELDVELEFDEDFLRRIREV